MKTHLAPATRDFDAGEFTLVIAVAFGLFILGSLDAAVAWKDQEIRFGDRELLGALGFELAIAPIVWYVLRARGWKWEDFALHYSAGTTLVGIGIAGFILLTWCAFEKLVGKVPAIGEASLLIALAVSIVNPLFEELLVLAYVVQSMRKRFGLVTAMNVSIAVRLLYHLYQGPMVVLPIAIFGVVVTVAYVRLGRLWPVVFAHGLLDFVAFMGFEC
jgi:uncharacterized protein